MTHEDLEAAFEGIPLDPRTQYPIGYLGFAVELDARIARKQRAQQLRFERVQFAAQDFLHSLRRQARRSVVR